MPAGKQILPVSNPRNTRENEAIQMFAKFLFFFVDAYQLVFIRCPSQLILGDGFDPDSFLPIEKTPNEKKACF